VSAMEDGGGDVSRSINHDQSPLGEPRYPESRAATTIDIGSGSGSSVAAPIDLTLGDSGASGGNGVEAHAAVGEGSNNLKMCNTSKVWDGFELVYRIKNNKSVRTGSKCHWCKVTVRKMDPGPFG
jgi:hypothetical protein